MARLPPPPLDDSVPQVEAGIPGVEAGIHVQEGARDGEGGTTVGDQPSLVVTRQCEYRRGGDCIIHGRGAIRKFRGGHRMTTGRGGVKVKKYQREYYYECEEGKKMIQTRLAFTNQARQPGSEARDENSDNTCKEGQNGNSTNHESAKQIDEKQ